MLSQQHEQKEFKSEGLLNQLKSPPHSGVGELIHNSCEKTQKRLNCHNWGRWRWGKEGMIELVCVCVVGWGLYRETRIGSRFLEDWPLTSHCGTEMRISRECVYIVHFYYCGYVKLNKTSHSFSVQTYLNVICYLEESHYSPLFYQEVALRFKNIYIHTYFIRDIWLR